MVETRRKYIYVFCSTHNTNKNRHENLGPPETYQRRRVGLPVPIRCGRAATGTTLYAHGAIIVIFLLVHTRRRSRIDLWKTFPNKFYSESFLLHDFIVKRAVDFVRDLLLHSLRLPAKIARHFYSCIQARIFEFSHRKSPSS